MSDDNLQVKRTLFQKIINVVIVFVIILFLILSFAFGFSQTKTFRNMLRNELITLVDSSTNATLKIGELKGSLFTSIKLNDVVIKAEKNDTLLSSRKIEVHLSPLQILLQKIYIRKIILQDVNFNLQQYDDGNWNLYSLTGLPDTVKSTEAINFPYIIQVSNLSVDNINFHLRTNTEVKLLQKYTSLNLDDFKINKLRLKSKFIANLSERPDIQLVISDLSFNANLSVFNLKKISGALRLTDKLVQISKFNLITDTSNISVDAKFEGVNFLDPMDKKDLFEQPFNISIEAHPLSFSDFASFVPKAELVKGEIDAEFQAKGTINNLDIQKLNLNYLDTDLSLQGKVLGLKYPDDMKLKLELQSKLTSYDNFIKLLPTFNLPKFNELSLKKYKLDFNGSPLEFSANLEGLFNESFVKFDAKFNFQLAQPTYNIKFNTENFDIYPFTKLHSTINSTGSFTGKGFKPQDMNGDYNLTLLKSEIDEYRIDSLNISGKAGDRILSMNLLTLMNYARINIGGKLDFNEENKPAFNIGGKVSNLNLASFMHDDQYSSALNFGFIANGKNFELDSLIGNFALQFRESEINQNIFEGYKLTLNFEHEKDYRKIGLASDFLDFNIEGSFSLEDAIQLLVFQSKQISNIIKEKIAELNPLQLKTETFVQDSSMVNSNISKKSIEFDFNYEFKNLDLLSSLLNQDKIGIAGEGDGSVKNDSTNFSINSEINLNHFYFSTDTSVVYISDLNTALNFSRDNRVNTFDKLFGSLSLSSERITAGLDFDDVNLDLIFNQNKFYYNASAKVDTFLAAQIEGNIFIKPYQRIVAINNSTFDYKGLVWELKNPAQLIVYDDSLSIRDLAFVRDSSEVALNGTLYSNKPMKVNLDASKIPLSMLTFLATDKKDNYLNGSGALQINFGGTLVTPIISINASMNNINLEGYRFGNLMLYSNYENKNMNVDFRFLDTNYNFNKPYLSLFGNIPIYLGTGSEKIDSSKKMELNLFSEGFNLAALGDLIPTIKKQKGEMVSNVKISGTFNKLAYLGNMEVKNCSFISKLNNLTYNFGGKVNLNGSSISLDSLLLENRNLNRRGKILGNGIVKLDGYKLENILVKLNGNLAVLAEQSQVVNPAFYGDLFVRTDGDLIYNYQKSNSRFSGKIILENSDLTLNFNSGGYSSSNSNLVYEFIQDSSKINLQDLKYKQLISERETQSRNKLKEGISNFDVSLAVVIENTASLKIILSPSFNQKLTVLAEGSLTYESIRGVSKAQGEFKLLNGSKLDFFKTLDATGTIRFENLLTDPFLDITATYNSDYIDPKIENPTPEPVMVQIKLKSYFSELGGNLASNKDNIQIFRGQRNITNNTPDLRYSAIDAVSFIIIGKFPEDFTLGDRQTLSSSMTSNAVNSFLGQALTALVNSKIGDVVNDIQLNSFGQSTRFNVSGKIQNFRYTIGGTQEIFQNLTKSNIRIEYLFNRNFLIRVERKEPIVQTSGLEEKISEFGLKYIIAF